MVALTYLDLSLVELKECVIICIVCSPVEMAKCTIILKQTTLTNAGKVFKHFTGAKDVEGSEGN
jgi:hypothetical protein